MSFAYFNYNFKFHLGILSISGILRITLVIMFCILTSDKKNK